jgi:phenylpyruvate tautomerase PptA (4-oxalocrotonate tautomerase family)
MSSNWRTSLVDYLGGGLQPELKRQIAERITAVLIEDAKTKRENIHVAFLELPATNYAELAFWS